MNGSRTAMVPLKKVTQIKNAYPSLFRSKEDESTTIYEAGMIEVLSELAKMHYHILPLLGPESDNHYDSAGKEADEAMKNLQKTFTSAQVDLLEKYEEAVSLCNHFEFEDVFVKGFIQGYQYLKQIKVSVGG